jgi:hypothetical protein
MGIDQNQFGASLELPSQPDGFSQGAQGVVGTVDCNQQFHGQIEPVEGGF